MGTTEKRWDPPADHKPDAQMVKLARDPLYEFARAAMTKHLRLGNLDNRHLFAHSSRG